jgi:hypothetical protein
MPAPLTTLLKPLVPEVADDEFPVPPAPPAPTVTA